ncbi:hypothetical protein GCK72_007282 [Caenorhabditis remanei]|uniref:F-box domain-containing protein n=1 Tax=Caenorhabditis remanei TaxID=31234 RepID=A0A6A5HLR7_CAERE|nr:hypothetical protein GCK72_007282 [Caenorhabditis remanei]KAF1767323.1 hypothetical protein GCK72_007282 [Caenorhabditis remanei]
MQPALSYLSTECVLKFLDSNKRIQLSLRCLALHQVEKSLPLYLDRLCLDHFRITINHIDFHVSSKQITAHSKRVKRQIPLPSHMTRAQVFRRLMDALLKDRYEISVNKMTFRVYLLDLFPLPENMRVKVKRLDTGLLELKRLIPVINQTSSPLKELKFVARNQTDLHIPMVHRAEKLGIIDFSTHKNKINWGVILAFLPNKEIVLKQAKLSDREVMSVVESWLESKRDIGASFTWERYESKTVEKVMKKVRRCFGGNVAAMEENEKLSPSLATPCLILPMNNTSELILYGTEEKGLEGFTFNLKMEIFPASSINSFHQHHPHHPYQFYAQGQESEFSLVLNFFHVPILAFIAGWLMGYIRSTSFIVCISTSPSTELSKQISSLWCRVETVISSSLVYDQSIFLVDIPQYLNIQTY